MSNLRGLAEVVLSVRDLDKSLRFYQDALGLQVISPPALKGAVFLQVGGAQDIPHQLVLAPLPEGSPAFPRERVQMQVRHYAIELDSGAFENERERLQGLGLEVRYGEHPFLPLRSLYIDDPDGNEIELVARQP